MNSWSIQRRVLPIALLPAAVLAVVMSACNAYQRIEAVERHAIENARAIAAEVGAVAGDVGPAAEDDERLDGLTNTLMSGRDSIGAVTLRDDGGKVILRVQRDESSTSHTAGDGLRITHPIRGPASRNMPVPAVLASGASGSVEIAVDLARARRQQIVPLLEGITLTAIALGLTAIAAARIGRGVIDPIHKPARSTQKSRAGDRLQPQRVVSGGEPGQLERAPDRPGHGECRPPSQQYVTGRPAVKPSGKVLVVDDQPVNLKLLESFLEGAGWQTVSATGSDEALHHARLARFDAILMDIHLPERDGMETSAILRMPDELNARTPILAVTADALAEQAVAAGMNDILVKPVSRTTLLERLAEWCRPTEHEAAATDCGEGPDSRSLAATPYYDAEDALTRAGGRSGVADELFTILCQHLPTSRAELRRAHDRDDPRALLTATHRLQGAAAYCGVPRLRRDIAVLDERVRHGDDPADALDAVCNTIDALLQMDRTDTPGPQAGGT